MDAPVSFHCIKCFEQLNLTNRAPVIFPCGHTYICEQCATKLDRCMKCNQLLTEWENKPSTTTPPPPLPMPKNHALMCLIEAIQNSHAKAREINEKEEEDQDFVLQGIQRVVGRSSAGTYMVRAKEGLIVHPLKRRHSNKNNNGESVTEEGYHLQYGQLVQINQFENGIAKVSNNAGFILPNNNSELVKVGELTSEVFKLEAISMALNSQLSNLMKKFLRVEKAKQGVDASLDMAMEKSDCSRLFGPVPEQLKNENTACVAEAEAASAAVGDIHQQQQHHHDGLEYAYQDCLQSDEPIMVTQSFDEKKGGKSNRSATVPVPRRRSFSSERNPPYHTSRPQQQPARPNRQETENLAISNTAQGCGTLLWSMLSFDND